MLRALCPYGYGGRQASYLLVKVTDQKFRARQTGVGPLDSQRRMNAFVPIRSNLLRFGHELQTVVDGSACAAAILWALSVSAAPISAAMIAVARTPRGEFRLPCSFEGLGSPFVRIVGAKAR